MIYSTFPPVWPKNQESHVGLFFVVDKRS
jgi:hypothetical protein